MPGAPRVERSVLLLPSPGGQPWRVGAVHAVVSCLRVSPLLQHRELPIVETTGLLPCLVQRRSRLAAASAATRVRLN
jgi:hypothetical protein